MDLNPFDGIITCGIDSLEVTQIKDFLDISMEEVKRDLTNTFKELGTRAA
mgnify:CR=1 FL=1